tara:strand:+ start:61 stop:477 length:417 start_codon:yes stop_codon:yes gene_type:complete
MIKCEEAKRWKNAMKEYFIDGNDDILFLHNYSNTYMVALNEEIEEQFYQFGKQDINLLKHNIRKFPYKKKNYVMVVFNKEYPEDEDEEVESSDADMISRMAFALNFMVSGFAYLFKEEAWEKIEKKIKKGKFGIKYIK